MTVAVEGCRQKSVKRSRLQQDLPSDISHQLHQFFTATRVAYIAAILSVEELRIISDLKDAAIIARIKGMSRSRLRKFDRLVPADGARHREYQAAQMEWIKGETYLLSTRLGRMPTHAELLADFNANQNGQRFRAYFAMKYPAKMRNCRLTVKTSD